jgi:hypothetical protein
VALRRAELEAAEAERPDIGLLKALTVSGVWCPAPCMLNGPKWRWAGRRRIRWCARREAFLSVGRGVFVG